MIWLKYIVPLLLWTCCNSQNVCEEPPETDFGEIVSGEKVEYQNGDRVQYRCFPGYALEGLEWITCKGSEWTPAPKCLAPCTITKQQLGAKNLFLSGGQRYSLAVQNNQTLGFLCRKGYVLSAPSMRRCIDGHMDLPSCISERGKNCSRAPTIENGDITTLSQEQYTSGSSVEFRCQRYYAMEGPSRSFCDNGNWTKVPVCLEPCVISLAEIGRQNISIKLRSNEDEFQTVYLPHGDSIEFNCKPGHVLATNPSQSVFQFQCKRGPIVYPECKEVVCPRPEVNSGRVRPHHQQYSYEETIQIQCDPGYEPEQQQATSQCTKNGWRPQPKCVSKDCNYPEADNIMLFGDYGNHRYFYFPKREGESIDFKCKDGFLPKNKWNWQWQPSMCTKSGWNPEPKCFKQCKHTGGFPHGNFTYNRWEKFIEGNEISFSCDAGYYPEQQEAKAKCTKNGWSPTPRCISREKPCGPPPQVFNASLVKRVKNSYAPGETVRYVCHPGFAADGPLEVTCRKGQWTEPPTCENTERNCGRPPVIQNGDILGLGQAHYPPGTTLQYKCQSLYLMDGSAEVHCENGLWTEPPTCIEACTVREEDMARNNIQLKWRNAPKLYTASGGVVEFMCRQNYQPARSSPPFRAQCINGRVEYPRCIHRLQDSENIAVKVPPPLEFSLEDDCGPPPRRNTEEFMDLSGKKTYSHGEVVTYNCRPGYIKLGHIRVKCNNGNWEQLLPRVECQKRPCGHPGNIQFGSFELMNGDEFVFGSRVVYQCDPGYQMLSQTSYRDCRADGWSNDVPHCEEKPCGPPLQLSDASLVKRVRKSYAPGETVHYVCHPGFAANGPLEVTCRKGQWTEPPTCENTERNCGHPPVIQNGDILNPVWALYPPGTTLQYQCQNLYIMNGSSEVRCANGLWTEPPTCIEPCTVREENMARNNIQLKWKDAPKIYSASGGLLR